MPSSQNFQGPQQNRVKLVVASSVMLSFISFWSAAAVVLNDLGSSAFYAAGIAETAIGKSAPWFILGVMFFSFAVRAVYVESCSMFTRGGVYRTVKEALGGTFAKVSVSALMFDYILTGPISGVCAGQYVVGLLNALLEMAGRAGYLPQALMVNSHLAVQLPVNATSAVVAIAITLYFWWMNVRGTERSNERALMVMKITSVMVVMLLGWGFYTVWVRNASLPPLPTPQNLHFSIPALGFLQGTQLASLFGLFGVLMAFGHSILAMSGEETLAQVHREIAHPKLKNLKRAAIVIALYSFIFTGVASLLAVMIIPDSVRMPLYNRDLLAGLAMYMVGPFSLRVLFRIFVVAVGMLILSGAMNASVIGSTGVLMRVAEDGVLPEWLSKPHSRYGTSSRIVHLVMILQLLAIVLSRGNMYTLGEAYAFGVIWSFTLNSLAVLVLRRKYKGERGWRVPVNLRIGGVELPIGLFCVFLVLLMTAVVNLFTKTIATEGGIVFAVVCFAAFSLFERQNTSRLKVTQNLKEHFELEQEETIGREALAIRPGGILVTMRDVTNPIALKWVLSRTDTEHQDVVVLTARMVGAGGPEYMDNQPFSEHEQMLFTKAVSVAESFGKHVSLLVVPAGDVFAALVQTANNLEVDMLVCGLSERMTAQEQAYYIGQAWESLREPKRRFTFCVVAANGEMQDFPIGPHTPSMAAEDVQLVHRLWLSFKREPEMANLHHQDIVTYALTRLASDYARNKEETARGLRRFAQDAGGSLDKSGVYGQTPLSELKKQEQKDYSMPLPGLGRNNSDDMDG